MNDCRDKSSNQLFQIVWAAAVKLYHAENGPEVRAALTELEERWHSGRTGNPAANVSLRLARVEEDLAAFKHAHAVHSHELRAFALHTLAPSPGVEAPTPKQMPKRCDASRRQHTYGWYWPCILPEGAHKTHEDCDGDKWSDD